jgi:transposase
MLENMINHSRSYGRVEIRENAGRRRRWSAEEKTRIVAASFAPGVSVSYVARQNDISPQHLFQWRRAARSGQLLLPLDDDMAFAPVELDAGSGADVHGSHRGLEVEIAGAVVRVNGGTDMRLLSAVVRALKAAA